MGNLLQRTVDGDVERLVITDHRIGCSVLVPNWSSRSAKRRIPKRDDEPSFEEELAQDVAGVLAVATANRRHKDAFVRILAPTVRSTDLDNSQAMRNRDKMGRMHFWKLPIHLYDRALFNAADTMKRWILAALSGIYQEKSIPRS